MRVECEKSVICESEREREIERKMSEFIGVCEGEIEMWKKRECVSRSSRNDGEGGGSATKVEERIKDRTCRIARQVHATSKPFDCSWRDVRNAGENGKSAREREKESEKGRKKERKRRRG